MSNEQKKSYTYKRFMRDGSMKEIVAVVRSRAKKKKETVYEHAA